VENDSKYLEKYTLSLIPISMKYNKNSENSTYRMNKNRSRRAVPYKK